MVEMDLSLDIIIEFNNLIFNYYLLDYKKR